MKSRLSLRRGVVSSWARSAVAVVLCLTQGGSVAWAGAMPQSPAGARPAPGVPSRPPTVVVNRTIPDVAPPAGRPVFSAVPTPEEIVQARVFAEALLPAGEPGVDDTRALAGAIAAYRDANDVEAIGAFEAFLSRFPSSAWRTSLEVNLARIYVRRGEFSRALGLWDAAWRRTRDDLTPYGRAVADDAMGAALEFLTRLGRRDAIEERLRDAGAREFRGAAASRVEEARGAARLLSTRAEEFFSCGRHALALLWPLIKASEALPVALTRPGTDDESLADLRGLATGLGLGLEMVRRPAADAEPVVPAILHLHLGHWTVLVRSDGERYLLRDPSLGGEIWVTRAALDAEWSGYALIPKDASPPSWRSVDALAARAVTGRSVCPEGGPSPSEPPCRDPRCCDGSGGPPPNGPAGGPGGGCGGSCASPGLATYGFHPLNASLLITDTPVGYTPPRGPAVPFTVRYDARQQLQPGLPTYGHLGPRWTHDWLSYAKETPAWCEGGYSQTNYCFPATIFVYLRGGGQEEYYGSDANGVYPAHWRVRAQLVRVSTDPIRYERRLADGGMEVYALPDTAPVGERRVFLTEVRDASGAGVTLTYDSQYRLVALTDALGQVTTLAYEEAGDSRLITGVTDPFGRQARFTYTGTGQLASITDVLGLASVFTYQANDFIAALKTPYGTTTFRQGTDFWNPTIEATNALGGTERLEFRWETTAWPATDPAATVPPGFETRNANLHKYTSLYWDTAAWATAPGDVGAAVRTRWLSWAYHPYATNRSVPVAHSVQRPGQARTWYAYPGQATPNLIGWTTTPSETARVIEGGVTQRTLTTVNAQGHVTARTDAVGRETTYSYAANGIDLLEVRQTRPGGSDSLAQYASYTATHQPQTVTDAAGETTNLTYNAAGQVLTSTNAKDETTTYVYDSDGRLQSVSGMVTGATTTYAYDGYGRVRTVTGPDGTP